MSAFIMSLVLLYFSKIFDFMLLYKGRILSHDTDGSGAHGSSRVLTTPWEPLVTDGQTGSGVTGS